MIHRFETERFMPLVVIAGWVSAVIGQTSPVTQWAQCEDYSASQGVAMTPYTFGEPRLGVKNCSNGNWLRYDSINFMAGEFDSVYFDCWTEWEVPGDRDRYTPGDRVVIRLDSPTGTILTTIPLATTMCWGYGASDRFRSVAAHTTGIHNVYLVFEGTGAICEADKFCLKGIAQVNPADARTYYVATNGDDGNNGLSLTTPFKTIQKAALVMKPGSTCNIRQGVYREVVTPAYTGLAGAPLTFQAYGNDRVVISGADSVSGWTRHSGSIYKAHVDWSMGTYRNQLLIDGTSAIVARSPNIDDPYTPPGGYENMSPIGVFNLNRWHSEVSPFLIPSRVQMWMQYDDALRTQGMFKILIQEYSSDNWLPSYLLGHPADYYKGGLISLQNLWWVNVGEITSSATASSSDIKGLSITARTLNDGGDCCNGQGFISYLLPLLDRPNEWFLDSSSGTVYLWTPDGGDPSHHLVEAKRRMLSVDLTGKQYVTLKGLWFLATAVTLKDAFYCTIDDCHFKYPSYFDAYKWYEELGGSHWFGTPFDASDGLHGVFVGGGYNVIQNSSSQISWGSGFNLDGKYQTVRNCIIHDVAFLPTYDAGIRSFKHDFYDDSPDGAGLLATNNTIYNCGRSAIEIDYDGNGAIESERSRICYNDLSRTGLNSNETTTIGLHGGVQKLQIDHNWFHSASGGGRGYLGSDPSWGCGAMNVHHNVFFKGRPIFDTPDNGAVGFHWVVGEGDSALRVINNTCVDSTQPGGARNWDLYPMTTFPAKCFANNIYGMSDTAKWKYTDAAHRDFTLRANSPAVDSGIIVPGYTDDVTDGKPDLGAYERGKTPWRAGADWQERSWVYPPVDITQGSISRGLHSSRSLIPQARIRPGHIVVQGREGAPYTVMLINAQGRTIATASMPRGGAAMVSTRQFAAGAYVLRISCEGTTRAIRAAIIGMQAR